MPKKKSQSVDSAKRQPKAPAKKRSTTPTSDTKVTTANTESQTYSRATDSVIDRIRSMASEPANNPLTTPLNSPTKKRIAPVKSTKNTAQDASMPVPPPLPTSVETRVGDSVIHYGKATDSVIDRIRSMVSGSVNTPATPPRVTPAKSPKKKRIAPANVSKKPSADTSTHKSTSSPVPADIRVTDIVTNTYGEIANLVGDRIRRIVGESANDPTTPAHSRKKKRVAPAKSTRKPSANETRQRPLPLAPAETYVTGAVTSQPAVDSATPHMSQPTNLSPDSYEIPFDVDAYLREKEEMLKPQLNRVRERLLSPSSRGWILVNMGGVRLSRIKLKRGMHLYWQVPEGIGQMMRGDHIFLWQTGIHGGMIGHGYLADLPTRFSQLKQPQIAHNLKNPGTNSHVVGVRVVSAHQRLTKEVMKTMPIINTIQPPSERLPHKQPLTTEQTFALLELWYM